MAETFDLDLEQARAYEDRFVPALFAQWVPRLLEMARVGTGQRVLDVACGTGVVARRALEQVGPGGQVSGLDLNPAMIEVARERSPGVDWRVGDAEDLPYAEGSFDVVLCQSALFFFPDPARALGEMARVARPGGVVALQTYAGLDEQPAYGRFVDLVVRRAGADARTLLGTYWSWGDLRALRASLEVAGLDHVHAESRWGHATFPSMEAFLHTEVRATPLATRISDATFGLVARETRAALAEHVRPGGSVELPVLARYVAGRGRVSPAARPGPSGTTRSGRAVGSGPGRDPRTG